eukprot:Nitzschia sp. Nitz4//scaffold103_size77763//71204//74282//NITZ4_005454-RA/size77763-processed-gene-0.14-mRNA-1//1//CDS//3329532355//8357//frame0
MAATSRSRSKSVPPTARGAKKGGDSSCKEATKASTPQRKGRRRSTSDVSAESSRKKQATPEKPSKKGSTDSSTALSQSIESPSSIRRSTRGKSSSDAPAQSKKSPFSKKGKDMETSESAEKPTETPRRGRRRSVSDLSTGSGRRKASAQKTASALDLNTPARVSKNKRGRAEFDESKGEAMDLDGSSKKLPPVLEASVHRLRHLDFIPTEVLALSAVSSGGYLAVSRADGSVELQEATAIPEYSDRKKWTTHLFPLTKIAGSSLLCATSLCWIDSSQATIPSCVAASADGTLWTVHFEKSQLQGRISSGGGGVFDLVACKGTELPLVAAACQDGCVRIWQTSQESGMLIEPPLVSLPNAGAAVTSLAWRCTNKRSHIYETVVFAGVADGTIRKYQLNLSRNEMDESISVVKQGALERMTVESRGRRTPTKVWTMQALSDDTLVTGNSLGQIQTWNTSTCTLVQSINQTDTKADVLKVVTNSDETKMFASGVDSRVVCLERQQLGSQWRFSTAQRPHTHDVKGMIIVQARGPTLETNLESLVTGGVDTKICSYVVSDFAKRRPRVWYPWPCESPISTTTAESRLLAMRRADHVDIFRLEKADALTKKSGCEQIGQIAISTASNLVASEISPDGKWLAVCNATSTFLFRLKMRQQSLEPEVIELPKSVLRTGVVSMQICGKNKLVMVDASQRLHVVKLEDAGAVLECTMTIPSTGESTERLPTHSIRISNSGEYIVAMSKSKEEPMYMFRKNDVGFQHYWTVPALGGARAADCCFLGDGQLAVATASFEIYLFDTVAKKLSPWSEERGFPVKQWPVELSNRRDFPVRLTASPDKPSQLLMSSFGAFVVLDASGDLPKHCRMVPEAHVRRSRKRAREDEKTTRNNFAMFSPAKESINRSSSSDAASQKCTVCLFYNSMLYMDFLGSDELVVVEQPWLRVISTLPEALQRRVYGCN